MLNDKSYSLGRLSVQGTSYDIGYQLGRFGARAVHQYLLGSSAWASVQHWKGSAALQKMAELIQQHFPAIWTELQGLAKGLQLPFDDVFLWNARGDVWAMAPDGCTTVMTPGKDSQRICHNEDGDPGFAGQCAIVQCRVDGATDFASFVYPGSLPGHTLAVNEHGLAMTVNNIRALTVQAGLPRMVLARAILDTSSVDAAVEVLQTLPRAGAFHLNLADSVHQRLVSVEYSSHYCSVLNVIQPQLHANHAIHAQTRDWPQIITGSSGHRQLRGDALLEQVPLEPLRILGDQGNADFPIYRRRLDDTDNENTLATADMIIYPDRVEWQIYENLLEPASYRLKNAQFVQ